MRILFICPYFYPAKEFGGPIFQNFYLCRGLAGKGHKVTVFTSAAMNQRENIYRKTTEKEIDGIKVKYFRTWFSKSTYQFVTPGIFKEILKEREGFDVAHLSEYRTFQNSMFYLLKRDIPYVISCRGSFFRELGNKHLKSVFDITMGNKIISNAKRIVVSSESERKHFNDYPELLRKTVEIPNFIPKYEFPKKRRNNFRDENDLKNAKIVLYLGRLHRMKGLDVLIRSFARVSCDNCCLVIAGPDSEGYGKELKKLAKEEGITEKIVFTGMLNKMKKFQAISECDLLVLPSTSEHESFGNVVLEALNFGKPVVVSDKCGISSYLRKGKMGDVVKSGNVSDLKGAIEKYLSGSYNKGRHKKKTDVFMSEYFDGKKIISSYEKIYSVSMGL